jgi:dihydroneopterin aldolase/2-amino-4-hydroxy-6-hydroxymethyldihydropteridine diphosphokinase
MTEINIKGLRVVTCHGALPQEKLTPQPFLFDARLCGDFFKGAQKDDLDATVNYADVCILIKSIAENNVYNLIEKLAYECAMAILQKFSKVSAVTVTVHKPNAPIHMPFDDVFVSITLERQKVYLSLGSSVGDRRQTLESALEALNKVEGVKVTNLSSFIETEPYGGVARNKFLNCAAEIECLIPPEQLLSEIHRIEKEGGRVRDKRWDDRTLDIDIIFFGNKIIAEEGLIVPHPDYFNRQFVLQPLKEIAPDFVCPLLKKRIGDIVITNKSVNG